MRNRYLRALLGSAISLVCGALVVRGAHLGEVGAALSATNAAPLGAAAFALVLTMVVRAWRWHTILGGIARTPLWPTFTSMMAGYLVNNVAPLRTGELVRVYLLHRTTAVSRAALLATVALERTLDGVFLVGCLAVLTRLVPFPDWAYQAGLLAGATFLAAGLGLAVMSSRRLGAQVRVRLLARLPGRLRPLAIGAWESTGVGMKAMRRPWSAAGILGQTALVWLLEGASGYLLIQALGLSLPPSAAALLTVGVGLGGAIPAGPSSVGTYEFLVVSSLAVYGLAPALALALAALSHGVAFGVTNLLALLALGVGWTVPTVAGRTARLGLLPVIAAARKPSLDTPSPAP